MDGAKVRLLVKCGNLLDRSTSDPDFPLDFESLGTLEHIQQCIAQPDPKRA